MIIAILLAGIVITIVMVAALFAAARADEQQERDFAIWQQEHKILQDQDKEKSEKTK